MNTRHTIKPAFNSTSMVMFDVLIALIPILAAAFIAFGVVIVYQLGTAIASAVISELLFSKILLKKGNSLRDGSAIITAILLVCTLSPLTPWYIVAFGSFSAIVFGKIIWGGLGKNLFNPALVGREFMSIFFSSIMTSPLVWKTSELVQKEQIHILPSLQSAYTSSYLSELLYKPSGALGEYSIIAIIFGGLYLLLRKRISWHIPTALLGTFFLLEWLNWNEVLPYSLAGILFGTTYMATDMPSSPTTKNGKLIYGAMIGVCIFIFLKAGVRFEYMSYAILLMNGFSPAISELMKPRAWSEPKQPLKTIEALAILVIKILTVAFAILTLYWYEAQHYVLFLYIIYTILKFNFSFFKSVNKYV
ncbi:RnfABCDGE type electron transport complex subunit D [Sphingobacterium sp. LRF_L2]|uniref:RnfABCDGE type electron transport complex subunit D n=1 Tax=Sphingobacterium sp. LRF_L2 TaxID=3369421 RepID=UPI003F5F660A